MIHPLGWPERTNLGKAAQFTRIKISKNGRLKFRHSWAKFVFMIVCSCVSRFYHCWLWHNYTLTHYLSSSLQTKPQLQTHSLLVIITSGQATATHSLTTCHHHFRPSHSWTLTHESHFIITLDKNFTHTPLLSMTKPLFCPCPPPPHCQSQWGRANTLKQISPNNTCLVKSSK